jgi:hypothetical protein
MPESSAATECGWCSGEIKVPYKAKGDTICFGCHRDWIKAGKP